MSWSDIFPVLDDSMVAAYQAEATPDEKRDLGRLFEAEGIFNPRPAKHIVSTSLFWKPTRKAEPDYPAPSREVMENPEKFGLSSRFESPWDHYVVPLLTTARTLRTERPDLTPRVYLANDLAFLIEELTSADCEVYLMKSSSLRHNPGAMWRFLAMEEAGLVTVCDSDRAEDLLHNVERTELLATGTLKYWRTPYFPGEVGGNYGCPSTYRSTNACHFGAATSLPIRLLAEALLWNVARKKIETRCTVGPLKIPIYGTNWPDYGYDEYFLNTAVYPRMAKEGILTLLYRRDQSHSYWLALDLEFCAKANSNSETLHWGSPWKEPVDTEVEINPNRHFPKTETS